MSAVTGIGRCCVARRLPSSCHGEEDGFMPVCGHTVPQVRARCAFAFVLRFHFDKAVGCAEFGILLIAKETESVLGKDRILDRAICRTKRSEAVLLLHVLRNLE